MIQRPIIHPLGALLVRLARATPLSNEARRAIEMLPITIQTLEPHTDFVRSGDRSTHCCIVISGWVGRFKLLNTGERQFLAFHIVGDTPDLQSLHLPVADLGICALTTATVALVRHGAMRDLMLRHPDAAAALWRETLIAASIANEWMVGLGRRSSIRRLAHLFCEIYTRQRAAGLVQVEGRCAMPLTQTVMADALGMTPVHINRIMKDLRIERIVAHRQRTMIIEDWAQMSALAEFDPVYLHLEPEAV